MKAHIKYFGHSAFQVVNSKGEVILVDPYIRGNPFAAVTVDQIQEAKIVAISHGSFDHLGDAYEIVKKTGGLLVCGLDVDHDATRNGVPKEQIRHLTYGQIHEADGIVVRALEAHHVSMFKWDSGFLTGQPLSLLIKPQPGITIWYGGDTCLFGDIKMYGELYKPDVVVIAIGGRLDRRSADLTIEEAAIAVQWLNPRVVIPVHFPVGARDPLDFQEEVAKRAPQVKVAILKPGETLDI